MNKIEVCVVGKFNEQSLHILEPYYLHLTYFILVSEECDFDRSAALLTMNLETPRFWPHASIVHEYVDDD